MAAQAQHKVPRDAESVIYQALSETIASGPLTWEGDGLLESEKNEELQWMACHVLATLLHEGFMVSRRPSHLVLAI